MKKIFFLGTPSIAIPTLEVIANDSEYKVIGVGVFPDKKVGRKQILTPCPVKSKAQELNLPIIEIRNKNDLTQAFGSLNFDLAIVIAFGMIIPQEVFEKRDQSNWDIVNVHFSLLPEYRGASPVQTAILNGETESGIAFQRMVHELDAGDILYEKAYDITGQKTSQLWNFFADETANQMPEFLENFFAGTITPKAQAELIQNRERDLSHSRMFEKSDGIIDPKTETARQIYQKYLAFDVWPGIEMPTKNKKIKTLKLQKISLDSTEGQEIPCFDGSSFFILEAQIPGKQAMKIEELLRGYPELCLDEKIK